MNVICNCWRLTVFFFGNDNMANIYERLLSTIIPQGKKPGHLWSPKSNSVGRGKYLDGWPPGNTSYCRLFFISILFFFTWLNEFSCFQRWVFTVRYLGVTFDSNLTWKNHINELCSKLSKTVGVISKLRYNVYVDILTMLYYSLIYPFLIYGVQVWGLTYPTYLKPVTTLQKRVVRIMTFSEPMSHSEPLFRSLNLLIRSCLKKAKIHKRFLSTITTQGKHQDSLG